MIITTQTYCEPCVLKRFKDRLCLNIQFRAACLIGVALASTAHADSERGEYLAHILGCGGCHTEGALLGRPSGPWLAGSRIGVAYEEDDAGAASAIVFPPNLTPDKQTGIGEWSKQDIEAMLASGFNHMGRRAIPVMPDYRALSATDRGDIADYLLSLPPVRHLIPENIEPGEPIKHRYVRVGVYLFEPENVTAEEEDF